MKTVTVLLSTYNGECYLKELLDSVLAQKNVNLSLLIRDDGSTDNTLSILKEYDKTNHNITLIEGTNKGYIKSFWSLLMNAPASDYYAFCDQDDIWQEDKCISAIQLMEKTNYKGPFLYTSNVKGMDENGNVIKETVFPVQSVLSFADSLQRGSLPGCTFIFNEELKKEAMKYHGPQISHDWTLYIIAKATGKVIYDKQSYIYYRLHEDNTVGIDESKIKHIKKKINRFINNDYKQVRSSIAKNILEIYGLEMSKEDKEIAELFATYTSNPLKALQLTKYKEYRNPNFLIQALTKKI